MVVRREKKVRKQRGSRTYGWGTVGQHRKSGTRGGFGNAGLHKHKWSWTVKYGKDHFGKYGFVNPTSKIIRWINIGSLVSLIKGKELEKDEKGRIIIDLNKMGYDKLLGSGKIDIPLLVKVKQASEIAKEKIISKGGEVIIT